MVCAGAAVFVLGVVSLSYAFTDPMGRIRRLLGLVILAGANPIRIPNTKFQFYRR